MKALFLFLLLANSVIGQESFYHLTRFDEPSVTATNPIPDLVWIKFPDGSGTTVTAAVGPNGTADGVWTNGPSSIGAMQFNGSTQELISNSTIDPATNIVTLTFWLKYFSGTYCFALGTGASADTLLAVYSSGINGYSYGTTGLRREQTGALATDTWYHIGVVFDNSTSAGDVKIYTNGVASTLDILSNTKTGTANFAAGTFYIAQSSAAAFRLSGIMADVRLYSGDRSASIVDIYNHPE